MKLAILLALLLTACATPPGGYAPPSPDPVGGMGQILWHLSNPYAPPLPGPYSPPPAYLYAPPRAPIICTQTGRTTVCQ